MPGTGLRSRVLRAVRADPDVMLYAARVSVWARWLLMLVAVVELAYRPELWYATDKEYLFLSLPLPAFNGFLHYRLRRDRAVTWRWLLFLSAVDIALITAVVIIGGEFHLFSYVAYYPALALFAVVFPHLWLSLAWATMAGAIYAVVSLMVGPGLDFDAGQEKALLARVMAMYGVVASVSLIARFERVRRQESAERERELQRERIELSQTIHDTVAQTAYMISLGIHRAIRQAGARTRSSPPRWPRPHRCRRRPSGSCGVPSTRATSSKGGSWAGSSGRTPRLFRRSRRSPPRCCSPGPSLRSPWRPRPASSPLPTTRSPTPSCTPGPAGSRSAAGLRDRRHPAVRLGRWDRPARGLRRARPGIQGHAGGRRAAGRQAHRGDRRRQRGNDRDLRDTPQIAVERRPGCR